MTMRRRDGACMLGKPLGRSGAGGSARKPGTPPERETPARDDGGESADDTDEDECAATAVGSIAVVPDDKVRCVVHVLFDITI